MIPSPQDQTPSPPKKQAARAQPSGAGRLRRDRRSLVLGIALLVCLLLACAAITIYARKNPLPGAPLETAYQAAQRFAVQMRAFASSQSWVLNALRLISPLIALYTVIGATIILFSEKWQLLRVRFFRGHVILSGLSRKNYRAVRQFRERKMQVVVIERNKEHPFIDSCRDLGAVVIIGDTHDPVVLQRAGVRFARYLIADTGDDGANAALAARVSGLAGPSSSPPLLCLIHLSDPTLCQFLRDQELRAKPGSRCQVEYVNVYDLAARALLEEHSYRKAGKPTADSPHVMIVGFGKMGQSLAVRIARDWRAARGSSEEVLQITVIDRAAARKVSQVLTRYPKLPHICAFIPKTMDVADAELQHVQTLFEADVPAPAIIYVCLDNDSLALSTGLKLAAGTQASAAPIVVRTLEATGVAQLIDHARSMPSAAQMLHAFPVLDRAWRVEILLGGTHEMLARALHESYRQHQLELGETPQSNPSMVAWEELPADLQASNRAQASQIGAMLSAIGFGIAPLTDWDAETWRFAPDQVEWMAQMEHQRFVAGRLETGWTYVAGIKDQTRKTNPTLIDWAALPEEEKAKARNAVRNLPAFLGRVGLQVYPISATWHPISPAANVAGANA